VCDSACGTGGFLIAAYEHILLANTSPEFIREVTAPGGQVVKRGIGDKLSRSQWDFLQKHTLHGFDGEQTFVRMTAMNALLHGFDHSPIVRRDSIGGSEDRWDEVQFDFILENPPFSGAAQFAQALPARRERREIRSLARRRAPQPQARRTRRHRPAQRHPLRRHQRAPRSEAPPPRRVRPPGRRHPAQGHVRALHAQPDLLPRLPENRQAHRESLVLPRRRRRLIAEEGTQVRPQFRNDFPDLLKKWPKRQTADGVAWRVPAKRIIENGYNLTLASLGLVEPEKTDHAEPEDILASVAEKEQRILKIVEEMRELVTAEAE